MERKVSKFGNSLGITMTDALKQFGLEAGDSVQIDVREKDGENVFKGHPPLGRTHTLLSSRKVRHCLSL